MNFTHSKCLTLCLQSTGSQSSSQPSSTPSTTPTSKPSTTPSSTPSSPTSTPTGAVAQHYGQCGGQGWTGPTAWWVFLGRFRMTYFLTKLKLLALLLILAPSRTVRFRKGVIRRKLLITPLFNNSLLLSMLVIDTIGIHVKR